MRILYAGDSPAGGPANYLLGVLRWMKSETLHLSPAQNLKPGLLKRRFDVILLSDFSAARVPFASEKIIESQVQEGTGLLMVGGWGSFSGPFGGWRGTRIEALLPVTCLDRDDRVNFPSGAWIRPKIRHVILSGLDLQNPPVICGLNRIQVKKGGQVILSARETLSNKEYPLLVIGDDSGKRTAAFATDLAPHWCGGLLDWGHTRYRLPVKGSMGVEVGESYLRFVSRSLRWLGEIRSR